MDVIVFLTLFAFLLFYWFDTARAKEHAVVYGKNACRDLNLQFLDDSVLRYRTRLRRGSSGQMTFERSFKFEYTTDGIHRANGFIQLLGSRLKQLDIDSPSDSHQEEDDKHSPRIYLH